MYAGVQRVWGERERERERETKGGETHLSLKMVSLEPKALSYCHSWSNVQVRVGPYLNTQTLNPSPTP